MCVCVGGGGVSPALTLSGKSDGITAGCEVRGLVKGDGVVGKLPIAGSNVFCSKQEHT